MQLDFQPLLNAIVNDYIQHQNRWCEDEVYREESIASFKEKVRVEVGRSYARIMSSDAAWGFVVLKDGKGFKVGDILKAASYKAPALNKARGNIIQGDLSKVQWTGPAYLR